VGSHTVSVAGISLPAAGVELLAFLIAFWLIGGLIYWLANSMAGPSQAGPARAWFCSLALTALVAILQAAFLFLPGPGTLLGLVAELALAMLVIRILYGRDWGRSLIIWLGHLMLLMVSVTVLMGLGLMAAP